MAIPITTGSSPKDLWPGIKKHFNIGYSEHPLEWPAIFDKDTSDKHYEEYVLNSGFGMAPVKPEGQGVTYDYEVQGYLVRLTHFVIAMGFIVTLEEIEDNLYAEVGKQRGSRLGFSMRQAEEFWAAYQYNGAFSTTYLTGGDSVAYISTSHPTLAGNQSNYPSTAIDICETSLEDLTTNMMLAQNYRGLKINLMPRELIVPPQQWYEANRILKSVLQNDTANNALNVLRSTNAFPDGIKMNHYLTSATAYFARATVPQGTGMMALERRPLTFTQDSDFDTDDAKHKATRRLVFGLVDWRALWGNPGA